MYRNLGTGRFEDVSAKMGPALGAENVGRGCAFGDFDNDGDIDVLVNNLDGPPTLLRNDGGNKNNWLLIKCVGTKSNRSAIGARVRVTSGGRTQIDEVLSGSSYYSQHDLRLHFGLGHAEKVRRSGHHVAFGREGRASRSAGQSPHRRPGDKGCHRDPGIPVAGGSCSRVVRSSA